MIRLPPTNALRAFEVAARTGSFVRAAAEMHLTPSAVSHQIATLERSLGVALFEAVGRQRRLTPAGRALAARVTIGLDAIAAGIAGLRAQAHTELRVSVLPSFATRWLVPRLATFQAEHPTITLGVEASQSMTRFREDGTHVAIRYGAGRWAGLSARRLGGESLLPVCAPALWPRGRPGRTSSPDGRRRVDGKHGKHGNQGDGAAWPAGPLLEDVQHAWDSWAPHADAQQHELVGRHTFAKFDDSSLVLAAAEAGLGIALARRRLADALLRRGSLVRLAGPEVAAEFAYHLVGPAVVFTLPAVQAFVDWLGRQFDDENVQSIVAR